MWALLAAHILAWGVGSINLKKFFVEYVKEFSKVERLIAYTFFIPVGIAAVILESFMAAGYWPHYSAFVYEAVLIFFLLIGFFDFVSLLLKPE